MKKLSVLILATVLLLSFFGCDGEHEHSYVSNITTAPTCEADGVATYTCSCGDTYNEVVLATGHSFGEWEQVLAPTFLSNGKKVSTCSVCSATKECEIEKLSLESAFKSLPGRVHELGLFTSANQLVADEILDWASAFIEPVSEEKDFVDYVFSYTYSVDEIDSMTNSLLGIKYDFATITNTLYPYDNVEYFYDANARTVTVVYHGAFGSETPEVSYKSYRAVDDTHYEITYSKTYFGSEPFDVVIRVELNDSGFVVTSQYRA